MAVAQTVYATEKRSGRTKNYQGGAKQSGSHIRMFVCTKPQLHLIQWLRLNFTSAKLYRDCKQDPKQSYHQKYKQAAVSRS